MRTTMQNRLWLMLATGLSTMAAAASGVSAQCACDCDANGSGGPCNAFDLATIVDCINGAPGASCGGADVNCDGYIDEWDLDAATCGVQGVLGDCCQPGFGAEFTYQGDITVGGPPFTGLCDFEFSLWDDETVGMAVGPTLAMSAVPVTDGLFDVPLYFGRDAFDGAWRWLEIAVVCPSGGALTTLSPRQQLRPAPYAVRAGTGVGGADALNVNTRGNIGLGVADPDFKLEVAGNVYVTGSISSDSPVSAAGVNSASATAPGVFNRTGTDGVILEFRQDGTTEGTISVAGATVSYNAFTGSHYAWADESFPRGTLVVMTGENRTLHGRTGAEMLYGIAASSRANDPRCLGAFLAALEPDRPHGLDNPLQVMAVGNGEMWIVDTGSDVRPGDFLISSDVPGHAMLDDDARFHTGYVIARAAESVHWAGIDDSVDGRKHAIISVFFDSFKRTGSSQLWTVLEAQSQELEQLRARVAGVGDEACRTSAPAAASASILSSITAALVAAAGVGLFALRLRGKAGAA